MKTKKIFLLIILLALGAAACSPATDTMDNTMKRIQQSPQFKDGKFRNKVEWNQPPLYKNLGLMWEFVFGGENRTPPAALPQVQADIAAFSSKDSNQLTSTWLGHSSLLINIDGMKIVTDPVYEEKVSFFGPSRFNGPAPVTIDSLPEIDVVIISHNHYDHLNKYSVTRLNSKVKRFIMPLGVGKLLTDWGVPAEKITELDWWDSCTINERLTIVATPSQHFSGRGLFDRDETLWASWVIQSLNHKVYFSGDSGYFDGFKEIGDKYGPFDVTFLECGAYDERWHPIHMYPEETVQAHLDLQGAVLHPIHWATFNLGLHPWYEPMQRMAAAAQKNNIQLATPVIGAFTNYALPLPTKSWWNTIAINTKEK